MPIPGYLKVRGWRSGVRGAGLLKSLSCLYALPIHGYGFKPFSLRILVIGRNSASRQSESACLTYPECVVFRTITLADLCASGSREGHRFDVVRKAYLSPRSVGFNVQGVRLVVHRVTGEIMTLQSAHAADIGRLINPMQCRGQIEGAIAMGFGWALYEKMVYDDNGAMVNPALRDYRIPAFADVPRSEIHFADTYDKVGPLGAKAQGECAINCVAPAIANAVADATGVRFPDLPLTPDRIFDRLAPHPEGHHAEANSRAG